MVMLSRLYPLVPGSSPASTTGRQDHGIRDRLRRLLKGKCNICRCFLGFSFFNPKSAPFACAKKPTPVSTQASHIPFRRSFRRYVKGKPQSSVFGLQTKRVGSKDHSITTPRKNIQRNIAPSQTPSLLSLIARFPRAYNHKTQNYRQKSRKATFTHGFPSVCSPFFQTNPQFELQVTPTASRLGMP